MPCICYELEISWGVNFRGHALTYEICDNFDLENFRLYGILNIFYNHALLTQQLFSLNETLPDRSCEGFWLPPPSIIMNINNVN